MKVLCIPIEKLPPYFAEETGARKFDVASLQESDVRWIERKDAEHDFLYKHVIPYALFADAEGRFACYPRHGSEKRLAGLFSCGIGGHVEEGDKGESLSLTIENGLFRELEEEIKNFARDKITLSYLGAISEKESEVGLVHLGLVYLVQCAPGYVPEAAEELAGLEWLSRNEIESRKTELWTTLAFSLLRK